MKMSNDINTANYNADNARTENAVLSKVRKELTQLHKK